MKNLIKILENEFKKDANPHNAFHQKAYMKNQFEFFGIKTPLRRKIQKPFLMNENLPPKKELSKIVKALWLKPGREFQYFAQELTSKYCKQFNERDTGLFEFMITHKSWWDTVDFIAPKLAGEYFKIYPEQRDHSVEIWIESKNIWLQRASILFQLNYKNELDKEFLSYIINSLLDSTGFFINKAIGWVLRQYSRTNPDWVIDFANKTPLNKLSLKEALRLIN